MGTGAMSPRWIQIIRSPFTGIWPSETGFVSRPSFGLARVVRSSEFRERSPIVSIVFPPARPSAPPTSFRASVWGVCASRRDRCWLRRARSAAAIRCRFTANDRAGGVDWLRGRLWKPRLARDPLRDPPCWRSALACARATARVARDPGGPSSGFILSAVRESLRWRPG